MIGADRENFDFKESGGGVAYSIWSSEGMGLWSSGGRGEDPKTPGNFCSFFAQNKWLKTPRCQSGSIHGYIIPADVKIPPTMPR